MSEGGRAPVCGQVHACGRDRAHEGDHGDFLPMAIVIPSVAASPHLEPWPTPRISPREMQALRLTAEGLTNKEVAARMGNTVQTTKNQLSEVRRKMGVQSTFEAFTRLGWLSLPDAGA